MEYIRPEQKVDAAQVTDDQSVADFVEPPCHIPPRHYDPPKVLTWPGDIAVPVLRGDWLVKYGPGRYQVYGASDFAAAGYRPAAVTEPPLPDGFTWVASRDRRHASLDTRLYDDTRSRMYAHDRRPGRRGKTLCGNHGEDQERVNAGRLSRRKAPLDILTLPLCLLCSRSLAAAGGAA